MESAAAIRYEWKGQCPICDRETTFQSSDAWFRDYLLCPACGSVPRERALMRVVRSVLPAWQKCRVHESSPAMRGVAVLFQKQCPGYVPTHYFPNSVLGTVYNGFRNEDLERQTFPAESF